jgi:hypothetical protein
LDNEAMGYQLEHEADAPPIGTRTDRFMARVAKRLRALSTEHRHAVLAEARSHMAERAAELIAAGMEVGQAETTVVAAFGNPDRWAGEIVDAAFVDQHSRLARRYAIAFGACSLAAPLLLFRPDARPDFSPLVVFVTGLAVCSFLARQYANRIFMLIGLSIAIICFAGTGRMYVTGRGFSDTSTRGEYLGRASLQDKLVAGKQREIDLLQLGVRTFNGNENERSIPAALRVGSRYIVPQPPLVPARSVGPNYYCSAFKRVPVKYADHIITITGTMDPLDAPSPYLTVASLQEADQAWRRDGAWWIPGDLSTREWASQRSLEMHALANTRPGFDVRAAGFLTAFAGCWAMVVIAIHAIAVYLGRTAHRLRRRSRLVA